MTLKEVFKAGCDRLFAARINEARAECEHMLMQLLNLNRSEVLYRMSSEIRLTAKDSKEPSRLQLTQDQEKQFFAWIQAREKRIPLAYVLGDVFFHSLKLKVGPGCLIPRPETERLVDETIKVIREDKIKSPAIMDMGTGSGAIALALLSELKDAKAVLADVSNAALEIARANARELNLEKRAEFILSDLFLKFPRNWKFDLIVSNPPYLTDEDMRALQPEVAYEPRAALNGGQDGLSFYRKIIPEAAKFLKSRGWLGFEIGAGQAAAVCEELRRNGYKDLKIFKDHQDIERVILGRLGR